MVAYRVSGRVKALAGVVRDYAMFATPAKADIRCGRRKRHPVRNARFAEWSLTAPAP
jgi:hypothetical protein